ncbi:MAG: hypothetical protein WAN14_00535, partial [Candidatus Acidiferrales bacterium]
MLASTEMGKRFSARKFCVTAHAAPFYFAALTSLAIFAFSPGANPSERIHLIPKFVTGQTFRYQIETRTTT